MKDKRAQTIVIALSLGAVSCSTSASWGSARENANCLTVDQALSKIQFIEGAEVTACGFLKYEFEDKNLYADKRAAGDQSIRHCLALGKASGFTGNLVALTGRRVRISGVATANFCPSESLCPAACSSSGVFVRTVEAIKR